MKIELNKEDYEFLLELQHELLIQKHDCQADPRYWGVAEIKREYGVDSEFSYDGCTIRNEDDCEFTYDDDEIEDCKEALVNEEKCTMKEIVRITDLEVLCDFLNEKLDSDNYKIAYYTENRNHISNQTGCFITKRACKNHIASNYYHYKSGHTYAMTAWRNPEFERVLDILKNIELEES